MQEHIPVLKNEILDAFGYLNDLKKKPVFVDATLGAGGHSLALSKQISKTTHNFLMIGIDKDQTAFEIAKKYIKENDLLNKFTFIHDDYKNIKEILSQLQIDKIDGALIDLGVSSMQLDNSSRGFSFKNPDELLDMRMDQTSELTAKDIVNEYPQHEIERILFKFGEESFAKNIAKNICEKRKIKTLRTIGDLIEVLEESLPFGYRKKSKIHFATRTFQALRIEVNGELINLENTLSDFVEKMEIGARLAIITFHSLEDRIVKNTFRRLADPCICPKEMPVCHCGLKSQLSIITRRPLIATNQEIEINSRSRSAKLRVAEKV